MQIRQGAHASKFQQDWRAGRKGGVDASVEISARPDDRADAFTDVKVKSGAPAAAPAAATNGSAAPATNGATNGSKPAAAEGEAAWTKDQEIALIKALKAVAKDAADRCAVTPRTLAEPPHPFHLNSGCIQFLIPIA